MRFINFTSLLISTVVYVVTNSLIWSKTDARFDCVVAIAWHDTIIGNGVFIGTDTVLTSANVVEDYVNNLNVLRVYAVDKLYNESRILGVGCIVSIFGEGKHRKNASFWYQHGPQEERENSPLHDLYSLSLVPHEKDLFNSTTVFVANINKGDFDTSLVERHPFLASMHYGGDSDYIENERFMWAGFGFIDRNHLEYPYWLEIEDYSGHEVLMDCDEWIPREWGRLLCIENENDILGVPSGAPLFYRGKLVGIGSFTLEKDTKSILVFTDLRDYLGEMSVCDFTEHVKSSNGSTFKVVKYTEMYEEKGKNATRLAFS